MTTTTTEKRSRTTSTPSLIQRTTEMPTDDEDLMLYERSGSGDGEMNECEEGSGLCYPSPTEIDPRDDPANYVARENGLYFHHPGQADWGRVQSWTAKFYRNHVQGILDTRPHLQSRTNYILEHNAPNTVLPLRSLVTIHRQGDRQQVTGTQQ